MLARYRPVLSAPGFARAFSTALIARLPQGMTSLAIPAGHRAAAGTLEPWQHDRRALVRRPDAAVSIAGFSAPFVIGVVSMALATGVSTVRMRGQAEHQLA